MMRLTPGAIELKKEKELEPSYFLLEDGQVRLKEVPMEEKPKQFRALSELISKGIVERFKR